MQGEPIETSALTLTLTLIVHPTSQLWPAPHPPPPRAPPLGWRGPGKLMQSAPELRLH